MRFLLHGVDGVYNSTTKIYTFAFSRHYDAPKRLKVSHTAYSTASHITPTPHTIYMRSKALSRVIRKNPLRILKGDSHQEQTDVIAVLFETHERGRYKQQQSAVFDLDHHQVTNEIDIYFTDGDTILEGEAINGSTVTDLDIEAIADVKIWFDMHEARLLDSSYALCPNIGDNVRYIYSRSDSSFVFTGYADWQIANWGQGRGLLSTDAWQYGADGTPTNVWGGSTVSVIFGMKTPADALTTVHLMFKFGVIELRLVNGAINTMDQNGSYKPTGVALIPTHDYLITVESRVDPDGDGTLDNVVTAENLGSGAVDTGSAIASTVSDTNAAWWLSNASQHFWGQTGILAYMIAFAHTNAASITKAQDWIKAKYDGTSTTTTSSTEVAKFFTELNLK